MTQMDRRIDRLPDWNFVMVQPKILSEMFSSFSNRADESYLRTSNSPEAPGSIAEFEAWSQR